MHSEVCLVKVLSALSLSCLLLQGESPHCRHCLEDSQGTIVLVPGAVLLTIMNSCPPVGFRVGKVVFQGSAFAENHGDQRFQTMSHVNNFSLDGGVS